MTHKLYYDDAYIKEFTAKVTEVTEDEGVYKIVLEKTAFFPEEGGQFSDSGTIGGVKVLDVKEADGIIYHFLEKPFSVGEEVDCVLDFEERFEKMQCHTAEHLLCGIIHRIYGFENVGFHLGKDDVTFDVDEVLSKEELDKVEELANRAVFENVRVIAYMPSPDVLPTLEYRSKLELTENVRIVEIEGYDSCACCAPHVKTTGEIGLIKLLEFHKHRGGTRIHFQAGIRALYDYRRKYASVKAVSALTSTPQEEVSDAVEKLVGDLDLARGEIKALKLSIAKLKAIGFECVKGNAVAVLEDMSYEELREFSNHAVKKVGGILVALSGNDGDYKYIISSESVDLRAMAKEINKALCGRGGGRPEMIQGSFASGIEEIRAFFEK